MRNFLFERAEAGAKAFLAHSAGNPRHDPDKIAQLLTDLLCDLALFARYQSVSFHNCLSEALEQCELELEEHKRCRS